MNKYFEIAKINFLNSFVYLGDRVMSSIFIAIIIFILICLWKVIYAVNVPIHGFTFLMIVWYLVMTESITTSYGGLVDQIGGEVQSGDIVNHLNKPYSYILFKFASSFSYALTSFIISFVLSSVVALLLVGMISVSLVYIPFILISVFLAITLQFSMMFCIGISAFLMEDSRSVAFIYDKIVFTIGGMLIPLEFFPAFIQGICGMLPFSYIAYHPAKLFVMFSFSSFFSVALVQVLWILFFLLVATILFKIYSRRLVVNGG
jgi:ABC-2 type transport system permease protein